MFFDNEDNYDDCGKQGKDEYKSDICVFVGGGGGKISHREISQFRNFGNSQTKIDENSLDLKAISDHL